MEPSLSDIDGRAVDLFLDQGAEAVNGGVKPIYSAVPQERIVAVEQLLSLLDHMQLPEPPENLLMRTMQKIDRQAGTSQAQLPSRPTLDPPTL